MTARASQAAGFQVKALYTVPELATLIGMHHRTLRRWLAKKLVPFRRCRGAELVAPCRRLSRSAAHFVPRGVPGGVGVVEGGARAQARYLPRLR